MDDCQWMIEAVEAITDTVETISPSDWAEAHRYMPKEVSNNPGPFSFDVTPYLREVVDCFDVFSPVREVSVMKGVQLGFTVGMENVLGYFMGAVGTAPMMFVTATDDLARARMDDHIMKMVEQSGLSDLIGGADPRKSAKTNIRLKLTAGGMLMPISARSAAKLRSFPIRVLILDELDGYPKHVGKEGDPVSLAEARTLGFTPTRKIGRISTPLLAGESKIHDHYSRGDRRKYYVPCRKCGEMQELKFNKKTSDGLVYGLTWDVDETGARLVPGSVRYLCRYCQHPHIEENKEEMLAAGEWRPTAKPEHPTYRSYHISALYSPSSMQPWETVVMAWFKAWDVAQNRPKKIEDLQTFYNTILGEPFEEMGTKIKLATVSPHRRTWMRAEVIPNNKMREIAGGPASCVIVTADVHGDNICVAATAFTPGARSFVVDYVRFDGSTENHLAGAWLKLAEYFDNAKWKSDDGRVYDTALMLVDAGYRTPITYDFCRQWSAGVLPLFGRSRSAAADALSQPWRLERQKDGEFVVKVLVDYYKDRLAHALRLKWNGEGELPHGAFSVFSEMSDGDLRELTRETKRVVFDPKTNRRLGMKWHRSSTTARNELWDLSVYARAGLDVLAHAVMVLDRDLPVAVMDDFLSACETEQLYWEVPDTSS